MAQTAILGAWKIVPDRLHPRPRTRLVRWLLNSGPGVSDAEHDALIQDIDAYAGPVISSAI